MDWIWLLVVYLVVLVVMIIIHRQMRKHHSMLARTLIGRMDELVAHYTSVLWSNRDHIYQYEENAGLLFRTMYEMIHDPEANYQVYMEKWYDDITYAQSLVPDTITLPDMDIVRETDQTLGRVASLYRSLGVLIVVMTGGLYRLRRQPLSRT